MERTPRQGQVRRPFLLGVGTFLLSAVLIATTSSVEAIAGASATGAGTWISTGSMAHARWFHTATLLRNGKVLVTGGDTDCCFTALASAELYDPATGTWSTTGSMAIPRSYHSATRLLNGEV